LYFEESDGLLSIQTINEAVLGELKIKVSWQNYHPQIKLSKY
jgi:hypothetical protein